MSSISSSPTDLAHFFKTRFESAFVTKAMVPGTSRSRDVSVAPSMEVAQQVVRKNPGTGPSL